jgi:hypothetical protein
MKLVEDEETKPSKYIGRMVLGCVLIMPTSIITICVWAVIITEQGYYYWLSIPGLLLILAMGKIFTLMDNAADEENEYYDKKRDKIDRKL